MVLSLKRWEGSLGGLNLKTFWWWWWWWWMGGGGNLVVCVILEDDEIVENIPDFQDVEIRGRIYTILSVVLGLLPRCHRCKVRGHLAYQCVACGYCGSDSHTSEEHPVENAKMRSFRDVVGATQPQYEYGMEDESAEVRGEVENLVDGSELGPLTQMLQDSHGTGGEGLNEVKREEGGGTRWR